MQSQATPAPSAPQMRRVLGIRDVVLLNVAAVVGLRWLSTAAQLGPSSLGLWAIGLLVFFVPLALAVLELSSRLPGEGGIYQWSKAAFGDAFGFLAGWSYWISNLVFFPLMLLFGAGVFARIGGSATAGWSTSVAYNALWTLGVLWGATALATRGLDRAKWLQNVGAVANWTAVALLVAAAGCAWHQFGPATSITWADVVPDFGESSTWSMFASISFAYVGIELGPVLGGEIREPRRTIPRGLLVAGLAIAATYMVGTGALLVALPTGEVDLIGGIPQALAAVGDRLDLPGFGPLTAGLVALGAIGGLSAWINGTARLPFVVGVDRYLPRQMAALHPRHGTPCTALWTQSAFVTVVLAAALAGDSVRAAFLVLTEMTAILSFVPILLLFAALPVLRHRAGGHDDGVTRVPGGTIGLWLVSGLGAATTLLAIAMSLVPPAGADRGLHFAKVAGGCALLLGVGALLYARGRRRRRATAHDLPPTAGRS